jgi:hypothetical protein
MPDPFLLGYYEKKGIGASAKERLAHFQGMLDRWHLMRPPASCPKRVRAEFMARVKEATTQARDFYKEALNGSTTSGSDQRSP